MRRTEASQEPTATTRHDNHTSIGSVFYSLRACLGKELDRGRKPLCLIRIHDRSPSSCHKLKIQ